MRRALPLWGLSLACLVSACSADSSQEEAAGSDLAPIVDAHTFVVQATPGQDVEIAPDALRFARAGHEDLLGRRAGDVLVSTAGFARKVSGVRVDGDHLVVSTTSAALEDVFVQGHIAHRIEAAAPGAPPTLITPLGLSLPALKFVLSGVHIDGAPFGSLEITDGEFSFQPHVDVDVKIRDRSIDHFLLRAEGDAHASVHLRYDLKRGAYSASGLLLGRPGWVAASASPVSAILWVSGVPVLLTVKLELLVGGALEVSGDAVGDETFSVDAALSAGAEYVDHRWRNIGGTSFSSTPVGHATVPVHTLAGDVTLTARATLLVYELAGPFAAVQAYGGIGHEGDGADADWFGQVGVRGMYGGRVEVLGKALGGYEVQVFDEKAKFRL